MNKNVWNLICLSNFILIFVQQILILLSNTNRTKKNLLTVCLLYLNFKHNWNHSSSTLIHLPCPSKFQKVYSCTMYARLVRHQVLSSYCESHTISPAGKSQRYPSIISIRAIVGLCVARQSTVRWRRHTESRTTINSLSIKKAGRQASW